MHGAIWKEICYFSPERGHKLVRVFTKWVHGAEWVIISTAVG